MPINKNLTIFGAVQLFRADLLESLCLDFRCRKGKEESPVQDCEMEGAFDNLHTGAQLSPCHFWTPYCVLIIASESGPDIQHVLWEGA